MKVLTSSIKIEQKDDKTKRFRKELGDIDGMKKSLKKFGLIHPIVVTKLDPPEPPYEWLLVTGGRRLTAAMFLSLEDPEWRYVEVIERKNLNSTFRKELELEENIRRKDISWHEQCLAVKQLDDLKRLLHGSRPKGSSSDAGWTQKDTAKSIHASVGTVCMDIQLARDLEEMPGIRKKIGKMPKAVAKKFIEREKAAVKMKARLAKKEIILTADLIHGKCEEEILNLADNSIDCLITDPPWGTDDIKSIAKSSLCKGSSIQDSDLGRKEEMERIYKILIPELQRVMAPGAHFYIFFAPDWYWILRGFLQNYDFSVDPVPLIWPKGRGTMIPNPYHYVPSYEFIMYGCKNPKQRTLLKPQMNCLSGYPPEHPTKRIHPLQKPVELIKMLIKNSTILGERVLDPFSGSGVVLKAAKETGRRCVGFEADEKRYLASQAWLIGEEK